MKNYYNYFTEIEEHFVRRRGKHMLVSPMDWHLIASWRDAGVPLNVALRGIDIAMDGYYVRRTRGMSRINTLCYCHDTVMETYAGYLESRIGASSPETGDENGVTDSVGTRSDTGEDEFGKDAILNFLSEKISEIESLFTKQKECNAPKNTEKLDRVRERLQEIILEAQSGSNLDAEAIERDLGILDSLVCEELRTWLGIEDLETWEQEAKKDKILKVYKKQLPKESYEKMREKFFRDKIRKKFKIGELSLFYL